MGALHAFSHPYNTLTKNYYPNVTTPHFIGSLSVLFGQGHLEKKMQEKGLQLRCQFYNQSFFCQRSMPLRDTKVMHYPQALWSEFNILIFKKESYDSRQVSDSALTFQALSNMKK